MEAIEGHIQQYFGDFEHVFHELASPDIHVDICVVQPSAERDYYTLVTMGMGAPVLDQCFPGDFQPLAPSVPGEFPKHSPFITHRFQVVPGQPAPSAASITVQKPSAFRPETTWPVVTSENCP